MNKIFAIASAALLIVACGPKGEGSKEVRNLLPKQSEVDSVV